MVPNPPQTLSVKRKRNEPPVDALVVERNEKRMKSDSFSLKGTPLAPSAEHEEKRVKGDTKDRTVVWRLQTSNAGAAQSIASPTAQTPRRYHVARTAGNPILFEARSAVDDKHATEGKQGHTSSAQRTNASKPALDPIAEQTPRPRKRPGARTALLPQAVEKPRSAKAEPSDDVVRQFEKFSDEVEKEEIGAAEPLMSPSKSKYKPRAPKLRYKDRHPEKVAALDMQDPDAMDVDTDEYVYDTYVREIVMPDADGKIPEPQGTVGFIVINEEDEDWWNGGDESDKEFDTDDEDENAEDYYANDYPEDELSSDDEYGRDPYKYQGDEEYDLEDDARSDDDNDELFRQTVPPPRPGYWGRFGE